MIAVLQILLAIVAIVAVLGAVLGLPLLIYWGWAAPPRGRRWPWVFAVVAGACWLAAAAVYVAVSRDAAGEDMGGLAVFFAFWLAVIPRVIGVAALADALRLWHLRRRPGAQTLKRDVR